MQLKTVFVLLATLAASAVMVGSASAAGPFANWSTPISNNTIGNGNGATGPGSFQHLNAGTSDSGSGPATSLNFTVYDGTTTITIPGVETSPSNYEADLDTRPYPNGTVLTLDIVATNAGGTSTPQPLTHVVQNSAPTAIWNGPFVTNPTTLSVFVGSGSFATTGVEISVNGAEANAGILTSPNTYTLPFDPTQYPDGPVTVTAYATSAGAGNANSDSAVASHTFTILGPDTTDPVISGLMTPAANEVVSGNYILRVHATDDRGVLASGQYSIDGGQTWTQMQNQGNGNFVTHIDTTVLPNDSNLDVLYQVFDPTGNSDTADVLATVGNPTPPSIDASSLVVTQNGSLDLSRPTQVGDFLYARDMTATGYPAPVITYTYRVCTMDNVCTDAVTDGTYTVQFEDAGDFISLIAKATNSQGFSSRGVQFTFVEFPFFVEPTGPQSDAPSAAPAAVVTPAPVVTAPVVTAPVVTAPVVAVVTPAEQKVINVAQKTVTIEKTAVVKAEKKVAAAKKKLAVALKALATGTATPKEKAAVVAAKAVVASKAAAEKAVAKKLVVAKKQLAAKKAAALKP